MSGRRPGEPVPRPRPAAAPGLEPPLGQGAALGHWLRRARRLELPHAMVVEGAAGIGKTVVLRWLAAALQCPSELDLEGPCGLCRTCSRIGSGAFPDVHVVDRAHDEQDRREQKKSFHVIKVDQIRAAQAVLGRHPVEGRARVLVVADADTMEETAQNALLKTLEEPGTATFLLLEARRAEALLPTVRSRAQRLRVLPLDEATLRRELQRRLPDRSDHHATAARIADGSLGLALRSCTERTVQLHDLARGVLADTKGLRPLATAALVLAGERELRAAGEAARTFLRLLRAELRARRDALAAAAANSYPAAVAEPWTAWLESTLAAERDLDLLIPPEQVLTACLVDLQGP
ncbi:MAG: hypothetical protein KF830_08145 [Planctomycetes bacterium]|nr:hypothetical protein [Planctomycetota bacterium]